MPVVQAVQVAAPVLALAVPAAQAEHRVAPQLEKVPGRHWTHVAPVLAPFGFLNVPDEQRSHLEAETGCWPVTHLSVDAGVKQDDTETEKTSAVVCVEEHAVHDVWPLDDWYLPTAHAVQSVPPVESPNVPAAQRTGAADPPGHAEPDGHAEQARGATALEMYDPAGHAA